MHQLGSGVGGEGDEKGVYAEQAHATEEEMPVPVGNAVAGGAQGRHEGCRYGNSRKHRSLLLAGHLHYACGSAEQGYHDIEDGRARAGFQLRGVGQLEGRKQEIQGGSGQGDAHHHQQVPCRVAEEFDVVYAARQPYADNRAHKGGYQHGADYDGR